MLSAKSLPDSCPVRNASTGWLALGTILIALFRVGRPAAALERTNDTFKVFQFPADKIPCVDGQAGDWSIVPESYAVGTDQLVEDSILQLKYDPKNLDVRVKVGWVKGLNRLYFLYEAYDNYWDFSLPGLHNDTFEVVVDGDLSGGPLIERFHPARACSARWTPSSRIRGARAELPHLHAGGRQGLVPGLGRAQWIKDLPYANSPAPSCFAGESGRLTLEFWITPSTTPVPKARSAPWSPSWPKTSSSAFAGGD